MATYGNMVITKTGKEVYADAQQGSALNFTSLQIGSGQLTTTLESGLSSGSAYTSLSVAALTSPVANGQSLTIGTGSTTQTVTASASAAVGDTTISVTSFTANAAYGSGTTVTLVSDPSTLTALLNEIASFSINNIAVNGSTAQIVGIFQNTDLTSSTYTCEIGLFAIDPSTGNSILYAYANAGTNGDTFPPYSQGPFSRQFAINTAIGNATDVTATIPSGTYAVLDASNTFTGGTQTAAAWSASGHTGTTGTGRFIGALDGAPTKGTFNAGDFGIDWHNTVVWVCTAGGTPGTWAQASPQLLSTANKWRRTQQFLAGLTVQQLSVPSGLSASIASSGSVGSHLAANTTYHYSLTATDWENVETSAGSSVSVSEGSTAYPVDLTWSAVSDAQFINVYKNGNFLLQVAGDATSATDDGNTATTAQAPPASNLTGAAQFNGPATFNEPATFAGGAYAEEFTAGGTGTWFNMPTSGPSGIGTGGSGAKNPWVAYVSIAGNWFPDATSGDNAYRNTQGRILFGTSEGNSQIQLSTSGLSISTPFRVTQGVAASGLTGTSGTGRFIGAVNGAPTSGTFNVGDFGVDATNNMVWICSVAGSPGTWTQPSSNILSNPLTYAGLI